MYHNCPDRNYSDHGGSNVITFPSFMNFKVDKDDYNGIWEGVLYEVEFDEFEWLKIKVGSKILFEEDAEPAEKRGLKELVGHRNLKM